MKIDEALALIRPIPDFPHPGILFQDITPLLANGQAFSALTSHLAQFARPGVVIAGIEARGFIIASALAHNVGNGFIPIRKAGKLPGAIYSHNYGLEYGSDTLEIHQDAIAPGQEVLLIDDVLATGGTLEAGVELITRAGGNVKAIVTLLEIAFLSGRDRLETKYPEITITSLVVS